MNGRYLRFLRQEFERRQDKNPRYSLRAFARDLDVSSGALSQQLAGKRPIPLSLMLRLLSRMIAPADEVEQLRCALQAAVDLKLYLIGKKIETDLQHISELDRIRADLEKSI